LADDLKASQEGLFHAVTVTVKDVTYWQLT